MITFKNFKIFKYQLVDSTNDVAFEIISSTKMQPIVVVAEEQTKGRGRAGHRWHSPPGGLYFSIALLSKGIKKDSHLIVYSSLPVAETLMDYGLNAVIKLPNDVFIKNKKISGILGERRSDFLIIGIGINVNQIHFPEELSNLATSMLIETGRTFDRDEILYNFLEKFEKLILAPETHFERWLKLVSALGKRVSFSYKNEKIEGLVENIDEELNLIVEGRKFNIYNIFDFREL